MIRILGKIPNPSVVVFALDVLGVKIFCIALGSGASVSELQMITKRQRIFMAANYKAVILGGGGLRIGGHAGIRRSIFIIFQRRFARCMLLFVTYINCKNFLR